MTTMRCPLNRTARCLIAEPAANPAVKGSLLLLIIMSLGFRGVAQTSPPFLSGSATGTATSEVAHLSLRDAIAMAVRNHQSEIQTRNPNWQRRLALLPQVTATVTRNVDQISFAPAGINLLPLPPGFPVVNGPFSYSVAGVSMSQTLFSYESIQRFRATSSFEEAAKLSHQDTLDVVTLTVGTLYLQVVEASSRIEAEEGQVGDTQAFHDRASDELKAGINARIDLTRIRMQLANERYNLSVARNNLAVAKLNLSRAIGLPLGQPLDITDPLPYADIDPPTLSDALNIAYDIRSDLRAARQEQESTERALSAAKAERYPVVRTGGNYRDIGPSFSRSHGTFAFEVGISVPILPGRRIPADIAQAEAALNQRKAEVDNIRAQIDYDVRSAFLNLEAAKEQVDVTRQSVALATENLARSNQHFAAGVADSIEVIQSQQALASANDQYITSVYNHNLAKLALARALGVARDNFSQYLGEP